MPAKNCRVILKHIRKMAPGEKEFSIIKESRQSLRLLRHTENDNASEDKGVTISPNIPHYFNVVSVKEESPQAVYCLVQVAHGPSKYDTLDKKITLNCRYEFRVA